MTNFAAMKEPGYVITGINQLTKEREELCRPMGEQEARDRLARELESRRRQRFQSHKALRVERRLPVQLSLKFEDNEL